MENETGKFTNFGDLAEEYSNFKRAKAVIVPVPYEGTTTYRKGTLFGPRAIIEASVHMETFDDELNQVKYEAAQAFKDAYMIFFLAGSFCLAILGTITTILPGTKKPHVKKKASTKKKTRKKK